MMVESKEPKVMIIILNWNKYEDTLACLDSIYNMDYSNYEVLVIDNGSENDSVKAINQRFPKIRILQNEMNIGYTGGSNQGIYIALNENADYVWLLNADTVVSIDSLTLLVKSASESLDIAMVSPAIYYFDAKSLGQFFGSIVIWNEGKLIVAHDLTANDLLEFTEGPNTCLWGTALLIKISIIKKIGLLDEDFFAYYEDTEYSLRAIRAGYRNKVELSARIYHKTPVPNIGKVTRKEHYYYYMTRNEYLLWSRIGTSYLKRTILRRAILLAAECKSKGSFEHSKACIQGAIDGIRGKRGRWEKKGNIFVSIITKVILFYPYLIGNIIVGDMAEVRTQILKRFKSLSR